MNTEQTIKAGASGLCRGKHSKTTSDMYYLFVSNYLAVTVLKVLLGFPRE